jgi:FK506-binding protein 1
MLTKNLLYTLAIISYLIKISFSQGTQKTTKNDPDFAKKVSLKILREGNGKNFPTTGDNITVHYNGTFPSTGVSFDSSYSRNQPYSFFVNIGRVINCWDETTMRMSLGEKVSVICPYEIAYGENGNGRNIPPKANLAFEIDLLCIANNCANIDVNTNTNNNSVNQTKNDSSNNNVNMNNTSNSGNYLRFDCFDIFKIGFYLIYLIFV